MTPAFRLPPPGQSLSARLLVLTIFFVMLAEVLIYVPSIARFRMMELNGRLADARMAVLAYPEDPAGMSRGAGSALLEQAGVTRIRYRTKDGEQRELALPDAPRPDVRYDLRRAGVVDMVANAFATLTGSGDRHLRVTGTAPGTEMMTLTVDVAEGPLRRAMLDYSERILALSLVISIVTATLVYAALTLLMVRPMRRLTESMKRFREDPENATTIVDASNRSDEIGVAERELASMQHRLVDLLQQQERLASLGVAVTKINHDLKNILATARLVSDRLGESADPEVARKAPKLVQTIDRAVNLCVQTLSYAREGPPRLSLAPVDLAGLIDEVGASLPVAQPEAVAFVNDVPAGLTVHADREQLYRVFANVAHNAVEAGADRLIVGAAPTDGSVSVSVSDNGPGLPPTIRDNVFQPFYAAGKSGGSGLGLAIARDIVHAHGGEIAVESTGPEGTAFRLDVPRTGAAARGGATRRAAAR